MKPSICDNGTKVYMVLPKDELWHVHQCWACAYMNYGTYPSAHATELRGRVIMKMNSY